MLGRTVNDRVLTIPVKGVYFDQIKAGTKPYEYRLTTAYEQKRLVGRTYDRIVLTRGYPKKDDTIRRLTLPWRGYQVDTITHPHFGAHPVVVFAIDVPGGAA
ncbi:RNA-binding protein (plasmid) [Ralstonia pseudosolanacearum]|uniref:RNA-binding protein n=1 Tax=Ralstonia pseudosolanacearum TaxID=1310165 RepID=UPI00090C925D|nr:RNA-binding protein [Ralstonia pseudosolanacearum]API77984.1 RNA-binding protein [Ralstonia pseudosolanacearum]